MRRPLLLLDQPLLAGVEEPGSDGQETLYLVILCRLGVRRFTGEAVFQPRNKCCGSQYDGSFFTTRLRATMLKAIQKLM